MRSKKARPSTPDLKPLSLSNVLFEDQIAQSILAHDSSFNLRITPNLDWFFLHAVNLSPNDFVEHVAKEAWLGYHGFMARHCSDTNLWEILCPEIVHKTQVTAEWLTNFVATLPEGTKINLGGFKNV